MATAINSTNSNRFHNMPAGMLADAIGDIDARIKALETEKDAAKTVLKGYGLDRIDGERFTVSFVSSIRQSLDTAAVKAELGQVWFDDHSKLAEVMTMRVTVNKAALAVAA